MSERVFSLRLWVGGRILTVGCAYSVMVQLAPPSCTVVEALLPHAAPEGHTYLFTTYLVILLLLFHLTRNTRFMFPQMHICLLGFSRYVSAHLLAE